MRHCLFAFILTTTTVCCAQGYSPDQCTTGQRQHLLTNEKQGSQDKQATGGLSKEEIERINNLLNTPEKKSSIERFVDKLPIQQTAKKDGARVYIPNAAGGFVEVGGRAPSHAEPKGEYHVVAGAAVRFKVQPKNKKR